MWENYSNYFGEGLAISKNWTMIHFLTFYDWSQNGHGIHGSVI